MQRDLPFLRGMKSKHLSSVIGRSTYLIQYLAIFYYEHLKMLVAKLCFSCKCLFSPSIFFCYDGNASTINMFIVYTWRLCCIKG